MEADGLPYDRGRERDHGSPWSLSPFSFSGSTQIRDHRHQVIVYFPPTVALVTGTVVQF